MSPLPYHSPISKMTIQTTPSTDIEPERPTDLHRSATEEEIRTHIESLVAAAITAINTRNFNSSTPPWTTVAPNFSMPAAIGFRDKASTRAEYVDGFRKLAHAYPKFQIEALSLESYILREAGYAEVYLTAQSCGGPTLPMGMKRKAVSRQEFRRVEGVWLHVCETSFLGIGDGGAFGV